ncbi:MAG TPA: cupredoxin domain-containing protein [Candidatus Nanoarchaeia archaeon]|nr:cupredoxin domain-containing protein [Candidatus Nanoarchaeia archaeon]
MKKLFLFFFLTLFLIACSSPTKEQVPSSSPASTPTPLSPPVQEKAVIPVNACESDLHCENGKKDCQETGVDCDGGCDSCEETRPPLEISMVARMFEFEPSEIRVKQGEPVRLKITSVDVEHGIAIPAYNIRETLPIGEERVIEFIADQVGTFDFYCSVPCGSGHRSMKGQLVVEP